MMPGHSAPGSGRSPPRPLPVGRYAVWADEPSLGGDRNSGRPRIRAKLGEDVDQVGLDGGLRDEELLGDLLVGQTFGDECQHFGLPGAE